MSRNRMPPGQQVTVMEDTTLARLAAKGISKVAVLVPPWVVTGITIGAGALFHHLWGASDTIPWAVIGMCFAVMILTALTWIVSHQRSIVGRLHTTGTTFFTGLWMMAATITGLGQSIVLYLAILGGVTTALSWNIRHVIRENGYDVTAGNDKLAWLFESAGDAADVKGRMRTVERGANKIKGKLALDPGEQTIDDVQKRTGRIEAGMQFPPGSIVATQDPDRADHVNITVTDPRVLKQMIMWPGPSRHGASVADPLRIGLWQDQEPVHYTILQHCLQIMGMIGSGKSIGGAWNILAEIITRLDAAVIGVDITKRTQTLGPLTPALHALVTTKKGVRQLMAELQAVVAPRTDFLAANGFQKWVPGCGLMYLIVWIEEWPDVGNALGDKGTETFLSFLKACRSAGIFVALSLQRSDYTQMPTLARGQLGKMCFGVATGEDAGFGLSDPQVDAGASPESWQNKQPGMAFIDAPSIPEDRIAMSLRTFGWGKTDQEANAAMRAHAEQHPVSLRPLDKVTAQYLHLRMEGEGDEGTAPVLGTPSGPNGSAPAKAAESAAPADDEDPLVAEAIEMVQASEFASPEMLARKLRLGWDEAMALLRKLQERKVVRPLEDGKWVVLSGDEADDDEADDIDEGDPVGEYVKTEDPSPEITAGPNDPIEHGPDDEPFEFQRPTNGRKVDKAAALRMLDEQIEQWRREGRETFTTNDLKPVWEAAGWSRPWIIGQLNDRMDAGEIERDDEASNYIIHARAGVA